MATRPVPQRRPLLQRIIGRLRYYSQVPTAIYYRERLRFRLWSLRWKVNKPLLVFVRFGAIGDIVCTFPALEALQRAHSDCHCVYVTLAEYAVLPALAGFTGTVVRSPIHCVIPKLPNWIAPVVLAPQYTDELQTRDSSRHLVDEFCIASGVLCENNATTRFRISPMVSGRIATRFNLKAPGSPKTVAIHTGPSWKVREWPAEHWQRLIDHLKTNMGLRILHIGAPRHAELGKQEVRGFVGTESIVDQLSLEEVTALIAQVDLLIGIDSGMLHLAGAVRTPTVGLFGPTNPEFRIPRQSSARGVFHKLPCSFCHHHQPRLHWESNCPYEIECMRSLSVEAVAEACRFLLSPDSSTV